MNNVEVGRIVCVTGMDPSFNFNGSLIHPAIITRVLNDHTVHLTVFPDGALPVVRTSVLVVPGLDEASRAYASCYIPARR